MECRRVWLRPWRHCLASCTAIQDGGATALRHAIGSRFGLDPDRIVCGAGSDDLLFLLCHIYGGPGTELLMTVHGFSIYEVAGQLAGCVVSKIPEHDLTTDVDAILAAVTPATRMVFIANPNNPTGSFISYEETSRLRDGLPPHVLLVLDAAYAEYVERPDYDAGARLVDAGHNTVMTRTFSKMFGLGGLRPRLGLRALLRSWKISTGCARRSTSRWSRTMQALQRSRSPAGWSVAARTTMPNGRA